MMTGATFLLLVTLAITSVVKVPLTDAPAAVAEAQAETYYWLRVYNGHIAVFYDEAAAAPAVETTIEAESLRSVDREELDRGIRCTSYEDVLRLLEDFGS